MVPPPQINFILSLSFRCLFPGRLDYREHSRRPVHENRSNWPGNRNIHDSCVRWNSAEISKGSDRSSGACRRKFRGYRCCTCYKSQFHTRWELCLQFRRRRGMDGCLRWTPDALSQKYWGGECLGACWHQEEARVGTFMGDAQYLQMSIVSSMLRFYSEVRKEGEHLSVSLGGRGRS